MNEAKKLRALVPACDDPTDYTEDDCVMLDAADRIEALEARIAALRLAIGTVNGLILQPTENPLLDKIEDICDGAFAADDRARAALSPTPER